MRVRKALLHLFQFGYSEGYCSTLHYKAHPFVILHSQEPAASRQNWNPIKPGPMIVITNPSLSWQFSFFLSSGWQRRPSSMLGRTQSLRSFRRRLIWQIWLSVAAQRLYGCGQIRRLDLHENANEWVIQRSQLTRKGEQLAGQLKLTNDLYSENIQWILFTRFKPNKRTIFDLITFSFPFFCLFSQRFPLSEYTHQTWRLLTWPSRLTHSIHLDIAN